MIIRRSSGAIQYFFPSRTNAQNSIMKSIIFRPSELAYHGSRFRPRRVPINPIGFLTWGELQSEWPVATKSEKKSGRHEPHQEDEEQDHRREDGSEQEAETRPDNVEGAEEAG